MGLFTNLSKTLYSYFNKFIPSYLENTVPPNTPYPYLTYSLSYDANYSDNLLEVRVYSRSSSMVEIANICDKIGEDIGKGIKLKATEGGTLWLRAGSPFQQYLVDTEDINLKSVYINITMQYLI